MGPRPLRLLLLPLVAVGLAWTAEPQDSKPEYLVKAKLLHVLSKYVTWPDQPDQALTFLTVVGDSPFEGNLEAVFPAAEQKGSLRPLTYARKSPRMGLTKILFICESETASLPQILGAVKGQPVLTVSDQPGFASRGVMINLVYQGGHVIIEVNLAALQGANLRLSSQVLKLAKIVNGQS